MSTNRYVIAAALVLAVMAGHNMPLAHATPDVYAVEVGDDNGDGVIMEDESGWDCATMGNLVCGPGVVR